MATKFDIRTEATRPLYAGVEAVRDSFLSDAERERRSSSPSPPSSPDAPSSTSS